MTVRRFIFWAHLISGIAVGSVIFIMALTGIIMSFEPQLVDYSEKHLREVTVSPDENPLPVLTLISKAAEAVPGGKVSAVTLKSDPAASAVVSFGRDGGSYYVNPYTGAVLGKDSKMHDFMHWIEDIHRRLGTKDKGRAVTGACNFVFIFMILSGIYIWWPRNFNLPSLKAITLFNSKLTGKQRDWNWHNVIGFWCLPLLLVTTLTGLIMSYGWANALFFRLTGSEAPPVQQRMAGGPNNEKGGEKKDTMKPAVLPLTAEDFDRIGLAVQKRVPDWISMNIRLPQKAGGPVTVSVMEPKEKHKNPSPRSSLTYDTETGQVTKWEPFSESSRGKKLRVWVKYLHTGAGFGIPGQILALISALGALFLVWTGFALSWRRFFSKK